MIKIQSPRFTAPYDLISVHDDALIPFAPPTRDADESPEDHAARVKAALDAYRRRLRAAAETADWSGLIVEGRDPTRFRVRMIPGQRVMAWQRYCDARDLSTHERAALLLRLAIVEVVNWAPGFSVGVPQEHVDDQGRPTGLGPIAPPAIIDSIFAHTDGETAHELIGELGGQLLHHRMVYPGN